MHLSAGLCFAEPAALRGRAPLIFCAGDSVIAGAGGSRVSALRGRAPPIFCAVDSAIAGAEGEAHPLALRTVSFTDALPVRFRRLSKGPILLYNR